MGRSQRLQFAGGVFGITSRGNRRQSIYMDDRDRGRWLEFLSEVIERFEWRCLAYCQMGNHYHLVVETLKANLSAGMQRLNGRYAIRFNTRHEVEGHLFERPFRSALVESEEYLLTLVRYTVLNPVRAGLCNSAGDWPWSSYRATAGHVPAPGFLDVERLLGHFAALGGAPRARYIEFVAAARRANRARRDVSLDLVPRHGPNGGTG